MGSPVSLRTDYSPAQLRQFARRSKDTNQSRRLLSLAAVLGGMSRGEAARIGGMDRQTLRDWVHRFNARGPDGLKDIHAGGPRSELWTCPVKVEGLSDSAGRDRRTPWANARDGHSPKSSSRKQCG